MTIKPPRAVRRSSAALVALALVSAVLLAGCLRSGAPKRPGASFAVTERDFSIHLSQSHLAAGQVTFAIHNAGPDQHELIVVPERRTGEPIRSDGFTVNEEAVQSQEPGAIEPQRPGGTEYLRLRLQPGRYLLFCNMAGHFMAGMHAELEVTR